MLSLGVGMRDSESTRLVRSIVSYVFVRVRLLVGSRASGADWDDPSLHLAGCRGGGGVLASRVSCGLSPRFSHDLPPSMGNFHEALGVLSVVSQSRTREAYLALSARIWPPKGSSDPSIPVAAASCADPRPTEFAGNTRSLR